MLAQILDSAGLSPKSAAGLLGVDAQLFNEWLVGHRTMPASYESLLSALLGVDLTQLGRDARHQSPADLAPAIWYKFRGDELGAEDREYVFLIRRLGHYVNELETLRDSRRALWTNIFETVRENIDTQAPPRVQGRQAASIFRRERDLDSGAMGIGDVVRMNLRSMGLLIVESPVPKSRIEGCCFMVGPRLTERPCIFLNTHHSTWFRRNAVLLHEVCHAIFDVSAAGASVDLFDADGTDISEQRAEAFAEEALVPLRSLRHIAQRLKVSWDNLTPRMLAGLVAELHVEQRLIIRAAIGAGFLSREAEESALRLDIQHDLKDLSDHALTTEEYIAKIGSSADEWRHKRNTTVPSRTLRLPVPYVKAVTAAVDDGEISRGKAAEMLMIDSAVYTERFGATADLLDD